MEDVKLRVSKSHIRARLFGREASETKNWAECDHYGWEGTDGERVPDRGACVSIGGREPENVGLHFHPINTKINNSQIKTDFTSCSLSRFFCSLKRNHNAPQH